MEAAFGASFARVSIHTGSEADELARQVDAVAFTHGHDIYFSAGAFAPETRAGERLLAHELTHVVQQHPGRRLSVGAANDPAESEADEVADAVVQRLRTSEMTAAEELPEDDGQTVRRQTVEDDDLAQALRRSTMPEDELQAIRSTDEEQSVLPVRRSGPPVAAEPASAEKAAATSAAEGDAPLFTQALQAYRAGDLARAQELWQQVRADSTASDSERANATWNVGRVYQEQGNDGAALETYRTFLAMPGVSEERRAAAQRIIERMERDQTAGAGEAEAEPTAALGGAAAAHERTPTAPAEWAEAVFQQAVVAYRAGELRRALEHWQQVLDIDQAPESCRDSAIWYIGRVYEDFGSDRAALAMYRTFLAQPTISDERREVAQGIVERLEHELAESAPGAAGTETSAPQAGAAQGGELAAIKSASDAALPAAPKQRAQALLGLATAAFQAGDFATALEHMQQIMRTESLAQRVYTETLYNMGQCYRRMGNNGAAIDMYRGFIQQPDTTPEERARAQRLITMLQR